jgi:hypothetical protein
MIEAPISSGPHAPPSALAPRPACYQGDARTKISRSVSAIAPQVIARPRDLGTSSPSPARRQDRLVAKGPGLPMKVGTQAPDAPREPGTGASWRPGHRGDRGSRRPRGRGRRSASVPRVDRWLETKAPASGCSPTRHGPDRHRPHGSWVHGRPSGSRARRITPAGRRHRIDGAGGSALPVRPPKKFRSALLT